MIDLWAHEQETQDPEHKEVPFTREQLSVVNSTESKIVVNSTAGSGKSTLGLKLIFDEPGPSLYLSYNKAIVEDIRRKLPTRCDVSTFHAFGLKLIRENMSGFKVDFNKFKKIDGTYGIADLAQKHSSMGGASSYEKWVETCDRFLLDREMIPEAMECFSKARNMDTVISAEDMIMMPVLKGFKSTRYSLVVVDECGDLGIDKLLLLSTISTDRIILVGDVNQQINQYSGSDPEVFVKLDQIYNPQKLQINETFRCSANVIEEAKEFVPDMFGLKPGGNICREDVDNINVNLMPRDSLVICRSNAPLFYIAKKLIKDRIDFKISPKTVNKMKSVVKRFSKKTSNIREMREMCMEELLSEKERYQQNNWNPEIAVQKYLAIEAIIMSGKNLAEVETFIDELLQRATSSCKFELSTIHSAKGLESNNVFYLKQNISRKISRSSRVFWEKEAERNAQFVAITRSKKNLTYLD